LAFILRYRTYNGTDNGEKNESLPGKKLSITPPQNELQSVHVANIENTTMYVNNISK